MLQITGQTSDDPMEVLDGSFGCNLAQKLERVLTPGSREEMPFSLAAIEVAA